MDNKNIRVTSRSNECSSWSCYIGARSSARIKRDKISSRAWSMYVNLIINIALLGARWRVGHTSKRYASTCSVCRWQTECLFRVNDSFYDNARTVMCVIENYFWKDIMASGARAPPALINSMLRDERKRERERERKTGLQMRTIKLQGRYVFMETARRLVY